jgi:hypothetical protein
MKGLRNSLIIKVFAFKSVLKIFLQGNCHGGLMLDYLRIRSIMPDPGTG